jgi:periplasmic divalent cation tolerance protein
LYITTKDKEQARSIGRVLVEECLVACVKIIDGMESINPLNNVICEDHQAILVAKTRDDLLDEVTLKVKSLHSFTCPCIVISVFWCWRFPR